MGCRAFNIFIPSVFHEENTIDGRYARKVR